jgi:hypothetical protein
LFFEASTIKKVSGFIATRHNPTSGAIKADKLRRAHPFGKRGQDAFPAVCNGGFVIAIVKAPDAFLSPEPLPPTITASP